MFGGLGALIASEIAGVVRRNVVICGLLAFAALLVLCACGYALHALHVVLALHYGPVAASLWIAGGLLVAALAALCAALVVKGRRRPPRPVATAAFAAAPVAVQLLGSRVGWRAVLLGGVVLAGVVLGRQLLAGQGEDDADEG
ncbi:MAG: hypothetical protein DI527_03950 [Chelatococcus sp.]|nr:MAG: hypothetical protein DI527_03950 [Chelatococcus sp.]